MARYLGVVVALVAVAAGGAVALLIAASVPLPGPTPTPAQSFSHLHYVAVAVALVGLLDLGVLTIQRRRALAAPGAPSRAGPTGLSRTAPLKGVRGRLTTADGRSYGLVGTFVLGRTAGRAPAVIGGLATAINFPDTSTVSRQHAEIRVQGSEVLLTDLGSTNGTRWRPPGGDRWIRLKAGVPLPIELGGVVSIGDFEIRWEEDEQPV